MKPLLSIICCCVAAGFVGLGFATPQAPSTAPAPATVAKTRIGVFDSRGVALAYGRSKRADCMLAKVEEIRKAHDQAKEAGNEKRVRELEAQAVAIQDEIHKQVFSGAPIPEVLALIKKDMPAIAKEANVALIAGDVLYHGDDVELVDVTLQMCAPFEPDAATLKMIKDVMSKPPVPESELRTDR